MRSLLPLDPSSPVPLWAQLAEGLRSSIASGQIAPGEPIPSVRDLARQLGVNPATVARACKELADDGLIETRRGAGSVVAPRPARVADERARAL
ncbi:MAG: GntR family transcriptional regulator, partial [Pseudomonadota bacterium]